jgi:tetratricopeptide (TPR) repeat protein
MRKIGLLVWLGMVPVWAGEMPEKAANYHSALAKRPESAALFERFRDAWLEERSTEDLEKELLARAEAKEAGAWAMLARAYLAAGKTEQALEAFSKAREQSPAAWLDLEMARLRLVAKDFAAAEKDALAVPEKDPQRSDALKLAGLACLRAERIDDALAHWTKAVAAAPGDHGLLEDLTELTRREGRFDLALDYCGKWRDATTDPYGKAMATLRRSELLLGSQRFDEAMTELAAVLKVSADDSWLERETVVRAEQAHRQRGNATGWATWIGARAEEHPSRLNFRRALAQALAATGKTDEALEVLTEVMRRSPGDDAARWQRISLLEQAMKLGQAYDACVELAAKEKSEKAGLRLAELAFRLEKKDELQRALDGVLTAADPAKRVALAGLYARYGLPAGSERIWREEVGGEQGGQALRQLAKHLQTAGRDREANEAWKQLGMREVALDRIEAAQMLAAAGDREAAREILLGGRAKFSMEPGYEAALADLVVDDKADEARVIYLGLARAAKGSDELRAAIKGWLRAVAAIADPVKDLGEETADRCLRAAWLAAAGKPLPAVREGDPLERLMRQALLREQGRWADVVAMMEAVPGERGPLALSELAEAKTAAGDLAGALAAAQAWRGRVPDQAGPWLYEAGILEKLGKPSDATMLLRRAAARFEDNEDVARRLFAILQESLDPRESLEWAWKRHDRSQDEAVRTGWLREILQVSKTRDKLEDLKERFEERARRDPASPGPLVALAELAKARGDSQMELDLLRRAAVNAPRDVAVITALAALEERSGETARALERHASLARLAPGPDSARQLAQAKLRLGDIEDGMRDMQALAGEKGLDLRALEQSAGDLASRGYVEEAIRMLAAVEPAQRDARLYFVLGMLLDIDGREPEATDAFIKVMTEPDDPAEVQQRAEYGYNSSRRTRQYSQMFHSYNGREEGTPGIFTGLNVPQSLVEAKMIVKSQLSRLALRQGGEIWKKAAVVIPELAAATPEQWREVMDFTQAGGYGSDRKWWDFIRDHPGNPLGTALLLEANQFFYGTPEQADAQLKTNPPVRIQMLLRLGYGGWRADNPEFLESIKPADWQDESVRSLALRLVEAMLRYPCLGAKSSPSVSECARGLAVLEKAGLVDLEALRLGLFRARLALLEEKPDEFVKHINAWSAATSKLPSRSPFESRYGSELPLDAFEHWRKKAGDAAAEALIARIESPVLRCQLGNGTTSDQRLARANRELAALPKDAPVETRRALIRMKWSFQQRSNEALRKDLEALAADDSDPRLALEAKMQLISSTRGDGNLAEPDRLKLQELARKLANSPNAEDQAYAAQFGGFLGISQSRRSSRNQNQTVANRWGASARFYQGNFSRNRLALPSIIAMSDKDQAAREAAKYLENAARASAGRGENLSDEIKTFSGAGLLEDAMARISLPAEAGLGRRVAMLTLFDACSKTDRARGLLEEIAKMRPWETRWTVSLALRAPDEAEMRRLLDSVAERGDFDQILGELFAPQTRENPDVLLSRLTRLADWAPRAKGRRAWMESAMLLLANGGRGGLQALTTKNEAQLACFRRYVQMALDDSKLGEFAFRVMFAIRNMETPEVITAAARRAVLSGAYTSDARTFASDGQQQGTKLAALEHLVLEAEKSGDDVAFPAEFRERLKVVDPDTEAWLARMLAAKTVAELPDLSNKQAKSGGWVALARHEAAILRAVKMPGRDVWLTGVFRDKTYQYFSENLRHIIRESLLEAGKAKALPARVLAWMEAAAGPRKDWGRKIAANDSGNDLSSVQLPQVAAVILSAAVETDSDTLLAVLDFFREARVPVGGANSAFSRLAQWWRKESQPPRKATLAELLGNKRDAAYTLGAWQSSGGPNGILQFVWGLPQLLQSAQLDGREEMVKVVKDNPEAGFPDLLQSWLATRDRALQRRALLKAAPDLAKLPEEIRRAVTAYLIEGMRTGDIAGLPVRVAEQLREKLDVERKQRIEYARRTIESIKTRSSSSANSSYQIGSLLGPLLADDEAFVTEVLAYWRPLAEADKSGKEIEAFAGGLISNTGQERQTLISILRLLDSLWKDSPPVPRKNSNWGDPLQSLWSKLGSQALRDPHIWQQVVTLSPKTQAQFWLQVPDPAVYGDFGADSNLLAALRESAKGSEVSRSALEWFLQRAALSRNVESKIDGTALLAFAKALKAAGTSPENIAVQLCRSYTILQSIENPGPVMAETPALLDGLKTFTDEQINCLSRGMQGLWQIIQSKRPNAGGAYSENLPYAPFYPVETTALLKFAFTHTSANARSYYNSFSMTPIVLGTGDGELLDLWIKCAGPSLVGDYSLIVALLEKDRIAEAVALAPAAGRSNSFGRGFSSHAESLVAKLSAAPSPQSFALILRFSMSYDATGVYAPAEKKEARHARLADEFERMRGTLTPAQRADFCLSFGLGQKTVTKHVPVLDEFASETVAKEYQKLLLTNSFEASVAQLFLPAVCSRMCVDDLSGLSLLAAAIAATPPGQYGYDLIPISITRVQYCLAAYANRLDAKIPQASAEIILAYAKALTGRKNPMYQGVASHFAHLAATDAASLAAGLKRCGLEGVKPVMELKGYGMSPETRQALMRVALFHPVSSETLLDSLGPPEVRQANKSVMLLLLREPALRAKISPALFLKWNLHLKRVEPPDLEAIKLYASERRGDFDEPQRAELDGLLERLQK